MNDKQLAFLRGGKTKRTLLTLSERKALHDVGMDEVHQTELSLWRECHALLGHALTTSQRRFEARMFLGSVMHSAVEDREKLRTEGWDPEFWLHHMRIVKLRDAERAGVSPKDLYYHNGDRVVDKKQIQQWAIEFTLTDKLGDVSLHHLLSRTLDYMEQKGYVVVANELNLSHVDGDDAYRVRFDGTLDFKVVDTEGRLGILDLKNYGILNVYLKGDNPSKVTLSPNEILFNTQLRHYQWLNYLKYPRERVAFYGIVVPTNLVPYKKSGAWGEAGTPKGSPLFIGDAMSHAFVMDYQSQVLTWLRQIGQRNFTKLMPTTFGKPSCPTCRHFDVCLKDTSATSVADMVSGPAFDYLRS